MKITVNAVFDKVSKSGKKYQQVIYNNGSQAVAFDNDFQPFLNKEVEVEETKSQDGKSTFIKLPGTESSSGKKPFTPYKNPDIEIRKAAAMLALDASVKLNKEMTKGGIIALTEWYETYIRDGEFKEKSKEQV